MRGRARAAARLLELGGGDGRPLRLATAGALTEQMRGDHVHFTRSGGDRIGALLDADIARAVAGRAPARACRRRPQAP